MAQLRWNSRTTLQGVQFDWEDTPTPRSIRLTARSPREGDPVRIGVSGVEIEGVIVRSDVGVLHVRLVKPKMEKADVRSRAPGKKKAAR